MLSFVVRRENRRRSYAAKQDRLIVVLLTMLFYIQEGTVFPCRATNNGKKFSESYNAPGPYRVYGGHAICNEIYRRGRI